MNIKLFALLITVNLQNAFAFEKTVLECNANPELEKAGAIESTLKITIQKKGTEYETQMLHVGYSVACFRGSKDYYCEKIEETDFSYQSNIYKFSYCSFAREGKLNNADIFSFYCNDYDHGKSSSMSLQSVKIGTNTPNHEIFLSDLNLINEKNEFFTFNEDYVYTQVNNDAKPALKYKSEECKIVLFK